jgi:signal transduction histidine kinase
MIGTSRGIGRLQSRPEPPLLNVSRATAERTYTEKEVLAGLALDYPQNGLTVELFASSSRTYPEQFQYVLRTIDDRGTEAINGPSRDPLVTFDGLKPGKYKVEARVFNADLVESQPLVFEVTIGGAPFPWTSTALGVLLTLALVALAWGWRQNRRIGSANKDLAETRFQLANETETERRRIARDLHDQTLADLRRLTMMTDHLPGASGNGHATVDAGAFRHEVESISTEIRRICEDLSPSALANVGLAAALEWALADAAGQLPVEKRFDYQLVIDERIDERLNLTPAEQIQIYRIVQEALSNVCRHSGASLVQLRFNIEDTAMVIELEDNGRGFEPVGNSGLAVSGRGLSNIRSRASLVQANVSWRVRPGGGTIFGLRKTC